MDLRELEGLEQFTGSENYYRINRIYPNVIMTDGAHYVAVHAQAYWLMEAIASHIRYSVHNTDRDETYVVCKLIVKDNQADLIIDNGNDGARRAEYAHQRIEYTDFPLDEMKLYAAYDGEYWIVMLPSEY